MLRPFTGKEYYVTGIHDSHTSRFAKEEALAEIHRVLKPGAKLGMIWNVEGCKSKSITSRCPLQS